MTGFGYNISGFGAFASRGVELEVSASSASTLNVKTLFDNDTAGSYAGSANKILTIGGSVALGPVTIPTGLGGSLTINNAGTITGSGGTGNGGAGGHGITMNANVTINNTGTISGGGGAGGNGGAGGAGGQGNYVGNCQNSGGQTNSTNGGNLCTAQDTNLGGNLPAYCGFTGQNYDDENNDHMFTGILCGLNLVQNGGAGGAGGTSAGVGAGFGVSASNGGSGSSGGGASNNAGAGGSGGAKGNGGALGAAGSTGATGSTGANGNRNNGSAGSSGTAGGAAGKAVNVAAGTLTYNDSGTTNGATN